MRRRKERRSDDDESEGSDAADEPEEFQDSGEDWTPGDTAPVSGPGRGGGRKRNTKPIVNNVTKRKRKSSSSEESEPENENENENENEDDEESDSSQSKDVPKLYRSGNFVLLKADVKWEGDDVVTKLKDLFLWKIDGKALLQKFVPIVSDGKTVHKCTCVYSGWNVENRENYYPITEILNKNIKTDYKEQCVALNLSDLVKVRDKR